MEKFKFSGPVYIINPDSVDSSNHNPHPAPLERLLFYSIQILATELKCHDICSGQSTSSVPRAWTESWSTWRSTRARSWSSSTSPASEARPRQVYTAVFEVGNVGYMLYRWSLDGQVELWLGVRIRIIQPNYPK